MMKINKYLVYYCQEIAFIYEFQIIKIETSVNINPEAYLERSRTSSME